MIDNLQRAYFERDLTEAEENRLAEEIASSPELALRFAQEAKASYVATGLPAPDWSKTATGSASTGTSGIIKGLLVGAILSGGLYWGYNHLRGPAVPFKDEQQAEIQQIVIEPLALVVVSKKAPIKQVTEPAPTVAPQRFIPGKKYEGLSAIVNQKSAGLVTVRVLNSRDQEVRLLFAGMLPPGEWTFDWDGHIADGTHASSGIYQVETQSGKVVLQKKVQINQN